MHTIMLFWNIWVITLQGRKGPETAYQAVYYTHPASVPGPESTPLSAGPPRAGECQVSMITFSLSRHFLLSLLLFQPQSFQFLKSITLFPDLRSSYKEFLPIDSPASALDLNPNCRFWGQPSVTLQTSWVPLHLTQICFRTNGVYDIWLTSVFPPTP